MPKQKTNKTLFKRVKLTAGGKLFRRNQLGAGHLRRNKSKSALGRHGRLSPLFKSEETKYKKLLGV